MIKVLMNASVNKKNMISAQSLATGHPEWRLLEEDCLWFDSSPGYCNANIQSVLLPKKSRKAK